MRLILPYHEVWGNARIRTAMMQVCREWGLKFDDHSNPETDVVWKLGQKHFIHLLHGMNAKEHENANFYNAIVEVGRGR